ncbi:MAG: hypothetical protein ACQERC_04810 [Bacteroidota bacterium]
MKNITKISVVLLSIGIMVACNDEEKNTNNNTAKKKKGVIDIDTTNTFTSDEFDFKLPQPFALAASFEEAGMTYDESRMNSLDHLDNYMTEGKQILNFGVYTTDLVYNINNEQPQYSMKYFKGLKTLADKIGMGRIFTEDELAIKIEQNIANKEKMEELLFEVHEASQEYLQNNQLRFLSVIQFAGAWVEGMYLASFDFDQKDQNVISNKIVDHMTLLNNTVKGIQSYDDRDEDLQKVLDGLMDIQSTYNNYDSVKDAEGMPKLSKEEINTFKEKIQTLRAEIIAS